MSADPLPDGVAPGGAERTPARGFARSALVMLAGVAGAQAITFLVMPVLTRLFPPEALGVQALFVSAAAALAVVATLRLDLAIVLPRDDEVAARIWWLGFYQALAGTALVFVVALTAGGSIRAAFTPGAESAGWVWLLAPMLLTLVVTQLSTGLATRQGRFRLVMISNLAVAVVFAGSATLLGALDPGDQGIALARLLGQSAGCLPFAALVMAASIRRVRARPRVGARRLWREQRQFLIFNTPYSLVGSLSRDFPLYIFAAGGGASVTAAYALARTVMLAPTSLASGALSSVFYREAALHLGSARLETLALTLTRWGLTLSLPGFAFVAVWGDSLFAILFGEPWRSAGEFARLLAFPMWLALQTGWPERLFEASRRQGVSFAIQMGYDALHVVVLAVIYFGTGSALAAVAAYAVTYSAYHATYLTAVFKVAGFSLGSLARVAAIAVAMFGVLTSAMGAGRAWLPIAAEADLALAAVLAIAATGLLARLGWASRPRSTVPLAGHDADSENTHA